MRLAEMIRHYEQDLLDKIHALEEKVAALTLANELTTNTWESKHDALVTLLLKDMKVPEDLQYEGRDFQTDLTTLVSHVIARRERGCKSIGEGGNHIPYIPDAGTMHKWLDTEAGFPLLAADKIAKRDVWIKALIVEFHKAM